MQPIKEIISKYIRVFVSVETFYPKLGRWNVHHGVSAIHYKIDQANTDHSCCVLQDIQKQEEDKYLSYYL
jgi:hypothetical protein